METFSRAQDSFGVTAIETERALHTSPNEQNNKTSPVLKQKKFIKKTHFVNLERKCMQVQICRPESAKPPGTRDYDGIETPKQ